VSVEPYTLARFMPAVIVGNIARVGKRAVSCTSWENKGQWRVPRAKNSLAQDGEEAARVWNVRVRQKIVASWASLKEVLEVFYTATLRPVKAVSCSNT